jgi:hypothetical protein
MYCVTRRITWTPNKTNTYDVQQRTAQSLQQLSFHFRRHEQLKGFIKKAEYNIDSCSMAKDHGFLIQTKTNVMHSTTENKSISIENADCQLGVIATCIILTSEKKIAATQKFLLGVIIFMSLIYALNPYLARYMYSESGMPFTPAGCFPTNIAGGTTNSGPGNSSAGVGAGLTNYRISPLCASTTYWVFSIIVQLLATMHGLMNLFVMFGMALCGAISMKRKELMLKECGILLQRQTVADKDDENRTVSYPAAISLMDTGNATAWTALRNLLLDFGITYQKRQMAAVTMIVLFLLLGIIVYINVLFDANGVASITPIDRYLLISQTSIILIFISETLLKMLWAGDGANSQTSVHLSALSEQRLTIINETGQKTIKSGQEQATETHNMLMGLHAIEGVAESLTTQNILYPITMFGVKADRRLLTAIGSALVTGISLIARELAAREGAEGK